MSKILIVDDSPVEIKIIRKHLGNEYEILEATNGQRAIELAEQFMPDLILMDIIMPKMDGLAVCKILKSHSETLDIPVIFITSASDSRDVVKGFEAGGQDYISKPFYSPELCARIKVHLDLKKSRETLRKYAEQLEKKNQALNNLLTHIETVAMTDFLTGLPNRRNMTEQIKGQLAQKQSKSQAMLILADIDHFKKINDTYGHDCGDSVLKEAASLMKSVVRKQDIVARWGGDEFLLMLMDAKQEEGQLVAEQIRQIMETALFFYQEKLFSVTITLGVAQLDPDLGFDASIKRADEALYKGKGLSRNCVFIC